MDDSTVSFGEDGPPALPDGRFNAPSFHRNRAPFEAVLRRYLARTGNVLEIGSGTGQHAAAYGLAFPDLTWWPSDPNPHHRNSVAVWAEHLGVSNVKPAVELDAAEADWHLGEEGRPPAEDLAAVTCMNVIHISPWEVMLGIVAGAGRHLMAGGHLFLYGPFKRGGEHTHFRNAQFDRSLRLQDESWGVRDMDDVTALAKSAGLVLVEAVEMPSNNLTLVYSYG